MASNQTGSGSSAIVAAAIEAVERITLMDALAKKTVMQRFADWIAEVGGRHPQFISDNHSFDWQFANGQFHHIR